MFTGIIEALGELKAIHKEGSNIDFWIESAISNELKVDQSIAHNGVCLTVVEKLEGKHRVTIIKESLEKSNLGDLAVGDTINLERCLKVDGRLDGHMVQGHVDSVGTVKQISNQDGSYVIDLEHEVSNDFLTVEKGSICVNGISLTVVNSHDAGFSIAIIPYTWDNTNLKALKVGSKVNLEFDILGKYMKKLLNKTA